jgi:hypothetical protein
VRFELRHAETCRQRLRLYAVLRTQTQLAVQIAGHDYLKGLGVALVPTSAPDFFAEDTPTAVLARQVLAAIAQFEKASLVAKMKAARDRKRAETGEKVGGRRSYSEDRPEVVGRAQARAPAAQGRTPLAPADFRHACRCRARQRQRFAVHRDVSAADAGAVTEERCGTLRWTFALRLTTATC